ncbi:hypothetical protein GCM10023329_39980 [Streptomyces sanyensis]|uniref:Uncharacterized protein n=1 Tax=Streptomyces sanyensis TaxID=568869 RepID=A0ABP9ASE1_9ACTN
MAERWGVMAAGAVRGTERRSADAVMEVSFCGGGELGGSGGSLTERARDTAEVDMNPAVEKDFLVHGDQPDDDCGVQSSAHRAMGPTSRRVTGSARARR